MLPININKEGTIEVQIAFYQKEIDRFTKVINDNNSTIQQKGKAKKMVEKFESQINKLRK